MITGGLTPFELKYGSIDAAYFNLPSSLDPGSQSHALLKQLDKNVQIVSEKSLKLQSQLAEERRKAVGIVSKYVPGDLVLWDPRERPSDYLESKLSPSFHGPFKVVSQTKTMFE